ncbi:FAD-binding oxidoreductase [Bdellovibrio sp. HCB337]|uniref:FAD-binding oxidoreductase n=1 Tax=Bdellovibrio sp. HCB337 TaxID=3394358 RepID=UPI0039A43B1B
MSAARTVYSMKVEKIIDHTHNVRELVLRTESPDVFKYKAGQFAMLHVPVEGAKPALRAYSIASDERVTNGFRLLFKFVGSPDPGAGIPDGLASTYVWSLKGGESLKFTGPFGKVFFQEPPTEQIVFLNTGTGISQHLSYLVSKKEIYPNLQYRMLFGVRSEKDIYIKDELDALAQEFPNFKYEFVLSRPSDSWTGKKGYIQHFIKEFHYKETPTTFYLCGNGGMIKEVKHQLLEVDGFDKTRLWVEAFD